MPAFRRAAVAGAFYPSDPSELRQLIAWSFTHPLGPGACSGSTRPPTRQVRALISPHAGYRYSGAIAAHSYHEIGASGSPDLVVVIGPNHRLVGQPVAACGTAFWQTPLGAVAVASAAASTLSTTSGILQIDASAHRMEHSIEVQVPFLQYLLGDSFQLLPIAVYDQQLETSVMLGHALAEELRHKNGVIIATSDFSHYESHTVVSHKDRFALRAIEDMDVAGLIREIKRHNITMCGPGPAITAIVAARDLGATRGRTLAYATSGDFSGDYDHVVGYASVVIE